ncbi:MAG: type II toxin-antitoxin system HicB family antitoxin [Candidatus Sungbacteria bacterium]|nr:type II toxin-antitoxin system HicB family antitoxin [Candidatus Sungbacteria bacterium]
MTYRLATVITEEGKWHVARAIELGVVSQGKTATNALKNLKEAVELYLDNYPD